MYKFTNLRKHTQIIIPLKISPFNHKQISSITGSAFSQEAGTVLYGYYNMEYLLPHGDRIRLIANHDKKTVQLMLFTHDPQLLTLLPGDRPSSLVADTIHKVHRYRIRSQSYRHPLSDEQQQKVKLANECIASLQKLLELERKLSSNDYIGHEVLRRHVIAIIEVCRDGNRRIANNPVVSEGGFGNLLYDAHKGAQHYQFNRVYAVSHHDQMDFRQTTTQRANKEPPCFVWDSEEHIGHSSDDLDDALRIICQHYDLAPAAELNDVPANRFEQLENFAKQLLRDGQDWIEYLAIKDKPTHLTTVDKRSNGVSITAIDPYYSLEGVPQQGYASINELVRHFTEEATEPLRCESYADAKRLLTSQPNGSWATLNQQQVILRLDDKLVTLRYFIDKGLLYPLPDGQDLYTLSQLSKRHLYLPERISLQLKSFVSNIPSFFQNFFERLRHFIIHDLHEEFIAHINAGHLVPNKPPSPNAVPNVDQEKIRKSLHEVLTNNGLLANNQTLEEFIKDNINNSPYVIARANHPPSHHQYDNPLHRALSVFRHFAGFFVDTSERNPIFGTLAIGAYFYGGGAIVAPELLKSVLTKLHLSGLISGIEPTQRLAHWMNNGTISEAITASTFYWQGAIACGNLDTFFVGAVTALKDDPAEIAIIAALALSLGFGLTKIIPSLQDEMGEFPYLNYAALGGKGGAAIYDTIMHPGDDWLLGTTKWFFKCTMAIAKLFIAPFIEGYQYGFSKGFKNGWIKSRALSLKLGKQLLAACLDIVLTLLTIPLLELSAMIIHVPFRGITNLLRKVLSTLGNISAVGRLLLEIARRPTTSNFLSEYKISPLYGFDSPFGKYADNLFLNILSNALLMIIIPSLQLVKNIIVLPLIDILSLIIRIVLTIINPTTRILAYSAGTVLLYFGKGWDNSIGLLFAYTAKGLTLVCDSLDNHAGYLKQRLLSYIEIARCELYVWAFHEEDLATHVEIDDIQYYTQAPLRCELVPHTSEHCFLNNILPEGQIDCDTVARETNSTYSLRFFKNHIGVRDSATASQCAAHP